MTNCVGVFTEFSHSQRNLLWVVLASLLSGCGGSGGDDPGTTRYSITTQVVGAGQVTPLSAQAEAGASVELFLTPAPGSSISAVTGCGGTLQQSVYTTAPLEANCVVSVEFKDDPVSLDCIPENPECTELVVQGDQYDELPNGQPSSFSGFADPSIRTDPVTGELWLAYSWPHYEFDGAGAVPSVDIHLARSADGGNQFAFVKKLWEKTPITNPADPDQTGYLDHETVNLLPVAENGSVVWYAVRLNYFLPQTGGFQDRPANSFHITLLRASSPEALSSASMVRIGATLTHDSWNAQALIPTELESDYFFWNEPSIYYNDGRLYLILVAFVFEGSMPVMAKNNVFVYSARPEGEPEDWVWNYQGKLVDEATANEIGGERVTQTDVSVAADGTLLLIATPDDWNDAAGDYQHKGCKVLEIQSLDQPELARHQDGSLKIRATITASDANDLGSAACAYEAASRSGILFTRRNKTTDELTASIWKTGLMSPE
jgi:hypothetical protein